MKKVSQYIYTIYVVSIFLITFIIQLPFFLLFSLFGKKGTRAIHILLRIWSKTFFFLTIITVRVYGKEKIEPEKKYVIVANHYSFVDTPMIFASLPFLVKPLARSDYGKIPIFGMIYRSMSIPVDRSSSISKKESYRKMLETILQEQCNVLIFPEGSFNETGDVLKPFFNGAFNLAKDSGCEILPIIFPDTIRRWHYSSFWSWSPGISRSYILDPIDLDTINSMTMEELKAYTHELMSRHLKILKQM